MVHQSDRLTDNERTALTITELKRTAQQIDDSLTVKEYRKSREFINENGQCIGYRDTVTIVTMKK